MRSDSGLHFTEKTKVIRLKEASTSMDSMLQEHSNANRWASSLKDDRSTEREMTGSDLTKKGLKK